MRYVMSNRVQILLLTFAVFATVSLTPAAGATEYDATYRGQITGKNLTLSGTQQWTQRAGVTTYARPCTITLGRSDS